MCQKTQGTSLILDTTCQQALSQLRLCVVSGNLVLRREEEELNLHVSEDYSNCAASLPVNNLFSALKLILILNAGYRLTFHLQKINISALV